MKNKIGMVIVGIIVLTVLLLSQAAVLGAKPAAPATPKFDDGNFAAPDYNNGATETFNVSSSRTFNYNCHCAVQAKNPACSGYIRLQMDSGSGFVNEKSDACNIASGATCSNNYLKNFAASGTYAFRVFCDENTGTDFTQPSNEYVTLTVQGCVDNSTRLCPLQAGVCAGAIQTCMNNEWTACDYGSNYGAESSFTCDGLDNNCNGIVDEIDNDGDGFGICATGPSANNELLLANYTGTFIIYTYNDLTHTYEEAWRYNNNSVNFNQANGEIGDVNHDGLNDFALVSYIGGYRLEVWSYNLSSYSWYKLWRSNDFSLSLGGVGDIADTDNDGKNEMYVTSGNAAQSGAYVYENDSDNAASFGYTTVFSGVFPCYYVGAAGDMNNNGIPELVKECSNWTNKATIWEWDSSLSDYVYIANVTLPPPRNNPNGLTIIDDMECGDVDKDGVAECVLCGNTGKTSVIDYSNGAYSVVFNSPQLASSSTLSETCSVGDITNDGWPDWIEADNSFGVRAFTYNGNAFVNFWNYTKPSVGGIGESFIGDSDNDAKGEFIIWDGGSKSFMMFESNLVGATSFSNTYNWTFASSPSNIIIGDFDSDAGQLDCNDNDPDVYPGYGC